MYRKNEKYIFLLLFNFGVFITYFLLTASKQTEKLIKIQKNMKCNQDEIKFFKIQ